MRKLIIIGVFLITLTGCTNTGTTCLDELNKEEEECSMFYCGNKTGDCNDPSIRAKFFVCIETAKLKYMECIKKK